MCATVIAGGGYKAMRNKCTAMILGSGCAGIAPGLRGENQQSGPSDAVCAPLTAVGFPNRVIEHVELQNPPETIWVVLKPFLRTIKFH